MNKITPIKGTIYLLDSRNLSVGVYDGNGGFIGIRYKFGEHFLFTEDWYYGPEPGTATPIKELGRLPDDITPSERISHSGGDLWVRVDGVCMPVIRRPLQTGQEPHGTRKGFEDVWAEAGDRLPDNWWPGLLNNQPLYDVLKTYAEALEPL